MRQARLALARPTPLFPLEPEPRFEIIDGAAVACDGNGVTSFNLVRYRHHDESIFLYAFDLIELNGDDLRRQPLEGRKATLESHGWPGHPVQ
jgi:ATP-dependent DNA ligase